MAKFIAMHHTTYFGRKDILLSTQKSTKCARQEKRNCRSFFMCRDNCIHADCSTREANILKPGLYSSSRGYTPQQVF
jgi:hypothetical protein